MIAKFAAWDKKEKHWLDNGEFQSDGDGNWIYYVQGFCHCGSGCNDKCLSVPDRIEMVLKADLWNEEGIDLGWWEGDIFDHPSGMCIIVWKDGGLYMHGAGGLAPVIDAAHWAVLPTKIGNRYENPELLKETVYEQ